jgi:iron-sulfur cluster repair protein YtfE (RIC family)
MAQQDAVTLLDDDHIQVEHLFAQYKSAGDATAKRMLTQRICQELAVHMQIEEEIFYPAFRQATGDDTVIQHSEREHREARELVATLEAAHVDDKVMLDLEEAIEHHVTDERQKMFPQARKTRGLDLMQLGEQLEQRKSELMAGHPA